MLCNKGRRQSPIDIEPAKMLYDPNLRPLSVDKHKVVLLFSWFIYPNTMERAIISFSLNCIDVHLLSPEKIFTPPTFLLRTLCVHWSKDYTKSRSTRGAMWRGGDLFKWFEYLTAAALGLQKKKRKEKFESLELHNRISLFEIPDAADGTPTADTRQNKKIIPRRKKWRGIRK